MKPKTKKQSTAIRTFNRRYARYKEEYLKLFGAGYQGITRWSKEEFRYFVETDERFLGTKRFTRSYLKEAILNTREQTVKQLKAAYQNLLTYYNQHKGDASNDIIRICKVHGFPDILTEDQFIREGGGALYSDLRAAGLDEEALGS